MGRSVGIDFCNVAILVENVFDGVDRDGGLVSVDKKKIMVDVESFSEADPRFQVVNGFRAGEIDQSLFFTLPMDQ